MTLFGETTERLVREGAPGACPVDLFPLREYAKILHEIPDSYSTMYAVKHVPSWLPGAGFMKRMQKTREYVDLIKNTPFEKLRAERVSVFPVYLSLCY